MSKIRTPDCPDFRHFLYFQKSCVSPERSPRIPIRFCGPPGGELCLKQVLFELQREVEFYRRNGLGPLSFFDKPLEGRAKMFQVYTFKDQNCVFNFQKSASFRINCIQLKVEFGVVNTMGPPPFVWSCSNAWQHLISNSWLASHSISRPFSLR